MKIKEFKALKEKNVAELAKIAGGKKIEVLSITARIQSGREKNLKKARNLRKEIAQILTIIEKKKEIKK